MSDDDIDHLNGLGYARDFEQAVAARARRHVRRRVLHGADPRSRGSTRSPRAGESMPPKSTYFFPKVPTGLLFNPLA